GTSGHVVGRIDKGTATGAWDQPDRRDRDFRAFALDRGRSPAVTGKAGRGGGTVSGGSTLGEAIGEREGAIRGAGALDPLDLPVGRETGDPWLVADPALRLREQVYGRVPAARNREQFAIDIAARPAAARPDRDAVQRMAPRRRDDRMRWVDRNAGSALARRLACFGAQIDDGRDRDPRLGQRRGDAVGVVVVGEHDR